MGQEGNPVMVNSQVNPVLAIRPGQVQRWRIFNASTARFYRLSLEGHSLDVIGTDGGPLDRPYPVGEILVAPAERLDVLVPRGPVEVPVPPRLNDSRFLIPDKLHRPAS
jgi:FtsP/CotA-like multicopper oxidase with cupredoxin domain